MVRQFWRAGVWSFAVFAMMNWVWADGVILEGVSSRALSRGGTNLGHADNGGIVHDNPAAMVNIEGEGLIDVGVVSLFSDFRYADPSNDARDASFTPLPQMAYIRKSADGIWAYGLGFFAPAGFSETYLLEGPPPLPGTHQYKSFGSLAKVLPAVSCRVTDRLAVGGTLGVGISHAELEGPYFLQGPSLLAGLPTMLDLQGTGAAVVWSLGLQYELTDTTTLGLTYLSCTDTKLDGSTSVSVPQLGSTSYDSDVEITWPQSVGLGIRHALCEHQTISADLLWYNWSDAFDQFAIRLSNPTNPLFPSLVERFPLQWRDTVSLRVGYEHELPVGGTVRLGYVHHRSPIPNATLTPFIQAIMENSFSLGYGWQWGDWEVDLGYMYLFGSPETVGTSQWLGGDFDNSRNEAEMHALFFGFMKRL